MSTIGDYFYKRLQEVRPNKIQETIAFHDDQDEKDADTVRFSFNTDPMQVSHKVAVVIEINPTTAPPRCHIGDVKMLVNEYGDYDCQQLLEKVAELEEDIVSVVKTAKNKFVIDFYTMGTDEEILDTIATNLGHFLFELE